VDVKEALTQQILREGQLVDLSGWLVDANDGLYILGDHFPEDYSYPYRIRVSNGNVIYPILSRIPVLSGGYSLLFYRTRVSGIVMEGLELNVSRIYIEYDRGSGQYCEVIVSPEVVHKFVEKKGDYKFRTSRDPMRDWLDEP